MVFSTSTSTVCMHSNELCILKIWGTTCSGKHAMKEYHTIKWEDVEVMNQSQRYQQRYTVEAWHIRSEQHKINRDESLFQLSNTSLAYLAIYYTPIHPTDFRTVPLYSIPTSTDRNCKLCMPKFYPFLLAVFCLRPIT